MIKRFAPFRILILKKILQLSARHLFKKNLRSKSKQSGQALVEYALLISVAVTISLGFSSMFNKIFGIGITRFNAILEQELKTGSYPQRDSLWEN